jgi:LacI family transcriptional regulator
MSAVADSTRRLTSLADVAERAGVSVATASRVLSNSDYPVAAGTRQRVLDAAADLDFTPNLTARGLVAQRTYLIGLVVQDVLAEHDALLVRGVEDMATENDFAVVVRSTDGDPASELEVIRRFRSLRTDAVIYGCSSACHDVDEEQLVAHLRRIEEAGGVLVRVAPHPGLTPDASFSTREALGLAVKHLTDLGHTRLAFVTGPEQSGYARVARHAIGEVLERHGLGTEPVMTVSAALSTGGGREAGAAIRDASTPVTAVIATDDRLAIGVMHALGDAGVSVPGDVSVMGIDDIPTASIVTPALTTIRVPRRELGRVAMQVAIWVLGGGARMGRNTVPVELVVRDSTGPA